MLNIGVLALSYPVYLKFLGYERLGVWLLLSSVVAFVQLTGLGLGPALTSLVAEAEGRGVPESVTGYISSACVMLGVAGLLVSLGLWAGAEPILDLAGLAGESRELGRRLLPWAGILSTIALLVQALVAVLTGQGRADLSTYLESSGRIASLGLSVLLLAYGIGLPSLMFGAFAGQVLVMALALRFTKELSPFDLVRLDRVSTTSMRRLWARSRGLMFGSLATMLLHPLNRFAIARWAGIGQVPVYEIAFAGAMQLRAIFESGVRAMSPEVSRTWGQFGVAAAARVESLRARFDRLLLALGGPTWLVTALLGEPLLRLWLRDRYRPGTAEAFRLMLLGSYLSLLGVPSFYVAVALGRTTIVAIGQSLLATCNIALVAATVIATGRITPTGMSLALSVAMGVATIYYGRATTALHWGQQESEPGRPT